MSFTSSVPPSSSCRLMVAGPLVLAVKVALIRAALMLLAVPVSWMPSRLPSASVRLPMVPLSGSRVRVRALLSISATVKSTSGLITPVLTAAAALGSPPMVGASFTAATLIATATAAAEPRPALSMALIWKAARRGTPLRLASGVETAAWSASINLLVLLFQALPAIDREPLEASTAVTSKLVTLPLLSAPLLAAKRSSKLMARA